MYRRIVTALASEWFWRAMLGLFVVQATYLALFGQFSMAFDEHFHLAAIQEYAKVIFPWQVTQPPGPAELSAFTTDGSYLYHYLMSFPYRGMEFITGSQTAHIVVLRLIDVAIVVSGWFIFRRLLLELRLSKAATHYMLALCMLMPMAPFMASQLTYDALFFTFSALSVLLCIRFVRAMREEKKLSLSLTAWTGAAVLATLQVKYAFFPAALGAGLYICGYFGWLAYTKRIKLYRIRQSWRKSFFKGAGALSIGVFLLCSVLFVQRYGMNYLRYGSLMPQCPVVLGHDRCLGFAPYGRDAGIREKGWYRSISDSQKRAYPYGWYKKMIRESYFAVGAKQLGYPVAQPIPVPYFAGKVLAAVGMFVLCFGLWRIVRGNVFAQLLMSIVIAYGAFLFAKNYGAFLATAVPVSIHGRYVLPFLPLMGYLVYRGVLPIMRRQAGRTFVALFAGCMLFASLWGGGITAYVLRSDDSWYWQGAQSISRTVRSIVWPVVIK